MTQTISVGTRNKHEPLRAFAASRESNTRAWSRAADGNCFGRSREATKMCWKCLGLIIVTVVAASPLHAGLSVDPVPIAKWKDCTNNTANELTKKVGQEVFLRRANVVGSLAEVTLAQCGYELAIARSGLSDGAVNKLIHDQRKILKQSIAKQLDGYDIEGL